MVTAALLAPATAQAGFPGSAFSDYEGKIERDPTADFGFDVDRINGRRRAHEFDIAGVPFSCHDGSSQRRSFLFETALTIRNGHFEGAFEERMGIVFRIEGTLRSAGRASGVLSLRGKSTDPAGRCYSGLLGWKAIR